MVPAANLDAWRHRAPWPNEIDVEQDLLLSRLIIEIASDRMLARELAFRGGTCLHKVHARVSARYSFRSDLDPLLVEPPPDYDVDAAANLVRSELLARLA